MTLWPQYLGPDDIREIEQTPLAERGLPATTYELLVRAAELWPDRPAVSVLPDAERWDNPVVRTFGELLTDVHRLANLLYSLGVRRGDPVALLSPNCDALITATLAAQLAGIAAPLNSALSAEHLRDLLSRAGAKVLIAAGPDLDPGLALVVDELVSTGDVHHVLHLPATGGAPLGADQDGGRFLGHLPTSSDLAALFHTGGTTGLPKLAAHTHENQVVDGWLLSLGEEPEDGAAMFAALPLFHVNALIVTVIAPLFRGTHVVWAGPLGYRDVHLYGVFWKLVERYRIAAMSAVPTVYALLAGLEVDADISSMRFAAVGASALPPAVRESFQSATGVPLVEGYGLTEATCASARSFRDHPDPTSVGQRLPYLQARTVRLDGDGDWRPTAPGEAGLLLLKGPTLFAGYVTGRDGSGLVLDTLGKVRDGWLDTGDLARVDDGGFIQIVGREKDLIIRGGHNIDPAVIEDALLSHADVTGAAAVGRPDQRAGEVPVAYVSLLAGSEVTEAQLRAWAAERIPEAAAAPKRVTVLPALPLTTVGKPYKLPLRAAAAQDELTSALQNVAGISRVEAEVTGGGIQVSIDVTEGACTADIEQVMSRYTLSWTVRSPQ